MAAANKISLATVGLFGDIDTVQRNPVGMEVQTDTGDWYIYLKGVAGCLVDDWVSFNATTYTAIRLAANAVGRVAIAPAAIVAANWGWFLTSGFYTTSNSDTVSAAGGLFIDDTTGRVDDASVAGDMIYGAFSTGADATNKLPVHIRFPYVTNTVPA